MEEAIPRHNELNELLAKKILPRMHLKGPKMEISGKIWKSKKDKFWLASIPFLDLLIQAEAKKEIPEMVKDASLRNFPFIFHCQNLI